MSQHDYVIDNQAAPAFRSDLNGALAAIATTNSGTSAPSTTYANQLWVDTTNNQLKIRNEDNDAWIVVADLDQTADTSAPPDASITFAKLAGAAVVTSSETIASNNNDTTIPTSAAVKAYADAAAAGVTVDYGAGNAALSAGGVGTYVFADSSTTSDVAFGATRAGSALRPTSAAREVFDGNTGATLSLGVGTALAGTWRAMGFYDYSTSGGGTLLGATLWLRIS